MDTGQVPDERGNDLKLLLSSLAIAAVIWAIAAVVFLVGP